jgi:SARP family transcriptional regulator, regulator of embCAB operon
MEVSILGAIEVRHGGAQAGPDDLGGRKPKQVLEILAIARGHPVAKDILIDRLWPDRQPSHPVAALENHVWVLRRRLASVADQPSPVASAASAAYRLDTQLVTLDIDVFDHLVEEAARAHPAAARRMSEAALALVRGDLLEDEPYADWAAPLRDRYRTDVHRVLLDAADAALRDGDPRVAVVRARQAMDLDPLSDRGCQLAMLALAGLGERQQALRTFETFRGRLRADLDLEPLPDTLAVYARVRAPSGMPAAS